MHESAIARALLAQVRRLAPPGSRVAEVRVEAGPQKTIDSAAVEREWRAATAGTELAGAKLLFSALPYTLSCRRCGREWTSLDPPETCTCGWETCAIDSPRLRLMSLELETADSATLGV